MSKPIVITFSGKARHGKDTAVKIMKRLLEEKGKRVFCINCADHLKDIAKRYCGWNGKKDEEGRKILQEVGTDNIRSRFPDYWVDTAIGIVKLFEKNHDYVLVGDCRFKNEIRRWKEEGYPILPLHVERLNFDNGLTDEQKSHASETELDGYEFADYLKASDLQDLEQQVDEVVKVLMHLEGVNYG